MAEPTGVIRPQPRNAALGAIADALARAHTAAARVQFNPQVAPQFTLADLLPLEGAAGLMQDVAAYGPRALIKGGNVATGGLGTFRPDPRVLDVAEAATYASPLTRLARPAGRLAAQQVERAMSEGRGPLGAALAPVRPLNVMKPKGGNWLAGDFSPEAVAQRFKWEERSAIPMDEAEVAAYRAQGFTRYDPETGWLFKPDPVNTWLDQKLAKYIRNEMATPEDPLRALIQERGVSHLSLQALRESAGNIPSEVAQARKQAGFPELGLVEESTGLLHGDLNDLQRAASGWETLADAQISPKTAERMRSIKAKIKPENPYLRDNPWLAKVPPETPVYHLADRPVIVAEELGFDHLIDELRNVVRADSDLPPELRLRPEQLSKVTVPQAVELVDRINKWRAAQKAEADLARSTNAATSEYKAYPTIPGTDRPNERGLRWVELKQPEPDMAGLKSEYLPEVDMWRIVDEQGGVVSSGATEREAINLLKRQERNTQLETALKYEGEVMGHCVGGYCPDVLQGKSRIFSLRDARGEPHVTVEVRPGRQLSERDLPDDVRDMLAEQYGDASREEFEAAVQAYLRQRAVPDEIVQIKGKANRAPKEDYLPFVQDFVRSGQWGRVGDLRNTGLEDIQDYVDEVRAAVEQAFPGRRYLTAQEIHPFIIDQFSPSRGYAEGGAVRTDPEGEDQAGVDRMVQQETAATGGYVDYAAGGAVKRAARSLGELAERYAGGGAVRTEFEYDPAAVEARAAALMEAIDAAA